MDTAHFEKKLQDRLADLESQMNRVREEAREDRDTDVRDSIDEANDSQISGDEADQSARVEENIEQIQDALDRIAAGTYGMCLKCDQEIEPARLEAVPWAKYCLKDQELLETATKP